MGSKFALSHYFGFCDLQPVVTSRDMFQIVAGFLTSTFRKVV